MNSDENRDSINEEDVQDQVFCFLFKILYFIYTFAN
jgi:hypothetical protein